MIDSVTKSIDEATTGFKYMQYTLLAFCLVVTIAIILISVKLFNQ